MAKDNSDSPPAEQIDDGEIMRRVQAELENAQTPFLTTTDIDDRLVEIKRDQVRKRLKRLRDEDKLASTKQQGYIWWIPEEGEVGGEIEPVSSIDREPNWDEITLEDIPPSITGEIADRLDTSKQLSLWDQIYDVAYTFFQIGAIIFSPGMALLLADTMSWAPQIPSTIETGGNLLFALGLVVAMFAGLAMGASLLLSLSAQVGLIPEYPFGYGRDVEGED